MFSYLLQVKTIYLLHQIYTLLTIYFANDISFWSDICWRLNCTILVEEKLHFQRVKAGTPFNLEYYCGLTLSLWIFFSFILFEKLIQTDILLPWNTLSEQQNNFSQINNSSCGITLEHQNCLVRWWQSIKRLHPLWAQDFFRLVYSLVYFAWFSFLCHCQLILLVHSLHLHCR